MWSACMEHKHCGGERWWFDVSYIPLDLEKAAKSAREKYEWAVSSREVERGLEVQVMPTIQKSEI